MRRDRERQMKINDMMKKDFIDFNGAKKANKLHQL